MNKFLKDHKNKRISNIFARVLSCALALFVWQILAMTIHQQILLVTPLQVVRRLGTIWMEEGFVASIWFTFWHITAGFILGVLLGIVLAVMAYRFRFIETILWPWMVTIKSVPVASFVVICLIWLSAKNLSIFISFLIVLPVIYQNMLSGLNSMDVKLLELANVYRVSFFKRVKYIILPQISAFLISALKVTAGMAWKAGVAAEIIGIPNGSIGKMLYLSKIYLDTDDLLAWTVVIVLISVAFEKIFVKLISLIIGRGGSYEDK